MFKWMPLVIGVILVLGPLQDSAADPGTGKNDVVTNFPGGGITNGTSVASLIGATRFFNAGFTGQGTIAANVEARHIWSGHDSLTHSVTVMNPSNTNQFDRHATWVGSQIGGRGTQEYQRGIAYDTDLRSGAIASSWVNPGSPSYALSFSFTYNSFRNGYQPFFGTADVINSSWGGTNPSGNNFYAIELDGLANQNSGSTFVVSAGNSGPSSNTIGFPGSGYNAITVAALNNGSDNSYSSVASFSSRGPQDFYNGATNSIVAGVRADVDIAAPGTSVSGANFGGATGGNALGGSTSSSTNQYSQSLAGTSFAAPITAGGVTLLKSASYNTPEIDSAAARDTLVVKSVLQNSADKIAGWNNGQTDVSGVVTTTQSLDYAVGAGKLNLDRAFDQYVNATTRDVAGMGSGLLGTVGAVGWDLGQVALGMSNLYEIGDLLLGNSTLTVTLNWFRDRFYDAGLNQASDERQADLNLQVLNLDTMTVIAESKSFYNVTEHLSFLLPSTSAHYGLRVDYASDTYLSAGSTLPSNVNYGIAWSSLAAVPEPNTIAILTLLGVGSLLIKRRSLGGTGVCMDRYKLA